MFNPFKLNKLIILLVFLAVVFGVYAWAVGFDYVQLDEGVLLNNNYFFISDLGNWWKVFLHDINYPSAVSPYYRPLFPLSFMLNTPLSGQNPWSYHLVNILLHVLASILVFKFFKVLKYRGSVAWFFSLVFALHPLLVPVVTWVPGRIEALLAIFVTSSLIVFYRFLESGRARFLIYHWLFFALALLTKEVALGLILILVFIFWRRSREFSLEPNRFWTWLGGAGVISVLWFVIRRIVLQATQINNLSLNQMFHSVISNFQAILIYLGKIVLPFNLTVLPNLADSSLIWGGLTLILLVVYGWWRKIGILSRGGLGLLWFLVFLLPNLISYDPSERMIFFEHRTYLPLIGLLIFLAEGYSFKKEFLKDRLVTIGGTALLVGLAILNINYASFYQNMDVFWQKAVKDSPQSARAHGGLMTTYIFRGETIKAEKELAEALALNPKEKRLNALLGLVYIQNGQLEKAEAQFLKELEIDPQSVLGHHYLGRVYALQKDWPLAEEHLLRAVTISPHYLEARQDLVILYYIQQDLPSALIQINEIIQRGGALHPELVKILKTLQSGNSGGQ